MLVRCLLCTSMVHAKINPQSTTWRTLLEISPYLSIMKLSIHSFEMQGFAQVHSRPQFISTSADYWVTAELLLGLLEKRPLAESSIILRAEDESASGSSNVFLQSKLKYTVDQHGQNICMLEVDEEEVGVMMGWERNIMQATVQKLCENHPNTSALKILNIGFGLGIVCLSFTLWISL